MGWQCTHGVSQSYIMLSSCFQLVSHYSHLVLIGLHHVPFGPTSQIKEKSRRERKGQCLFFVPANYAFYCVGCGFVVQDHNLHLTAGDRSTGWHAYCGCNSFTCISSYIYSPCSSRPTWLCGSSTGMLFFKHHWQHLLDLLFSYDIVWIAFSFSS